MKKLTLEFTPEELGVLTNMASDQLFRKQFLDPKMPGYRPNEEELELCKRVVVRLRALTGVAQGPATLPKKKNGTAR